MNLPTNANFQLLVNELNRLGVFARESPVSDQKYKQFIQSYPIDKLTELKLDDYCVGKRSAASFCWWLERGLQSVLGRYAPGTSRGHLLYFVAKTGELYKNRHLKDLSDADALLYTLKIQAAIAGADLRDAGADLGERISWIDNDAQIYERAGVEPRVTVGDGRKLRLLAAYHPDDLVPISSSKHVRHFLAALGCPITDIPPAGKPVARMLLLMDYFQQAKQACPGVTPLGFMKALYSKELGLAPVKADEAVDADLDDAVSCSESTSTPPLNQILFGPPGTGKTYATIERALAILDPELLNAQDAEPNTQRRRATLKARFDALKAAGRVRFVTFHQSFSYEDFIEGIRAQSDANGSLRYSVEPGVFKQLCEVAAGGPSVDSIILDFLDKAAAAPQVMKTPKGKSFTVSYQEGNETVACLPAASSTQKPLPANIESVRQVLRGQQPVKAYCDSYVQGIANHLRTKLPEPDRVASSGVPHVLVIDEINRGNVSRIFGELITLIEPSKRAGKPEELSTTLPYSREPFMVPDNVYLIGTMNTADRSLASLDIALRRRFVFEELPPQPDVLDGAVINTLQVSTLLSVINQRIEVLLDRDHLIGHAMFMPLVTKPSLEGLADIFRRQVLPLLQEYFFEDWQRIQWVLNDHRKPRDQQFVQENKPNVDDLFGTEVQVSRRPLWEINKRAFGILDAYIGVISSQRLTSDEDDADESEGQK